MADSWPPKTSFSLPSKTFQEQADPPFAMTAQGQGLVQFRTPTPQQKKKAVVSCIIHTTRHYWLCLARWVCKNKNSLREGSQIFGQKKLCKG